MIFAAQVISFAVAARAVFLFSRYAGHRYDSTIHKKRYASCSQPTQKNLRVMFLTPNTNRSND